MSNKKKEEHVHTILIQTSKPGPAFNGKTFMYDCNAVHHYENRLHIILYVPRVIYSRNTHQFNSIHLYKIT